jgi:serine kinase of HPr protein (carbohydrate metabolism regulator)
MSETRLHASCAVWDGRAVLLRGQPGAGKSELLLRLIVEAGADLLADDQVLLHRDGAQLIARPSAHLRGVLEVRGLGLVQLAAADPAPVTLLAELHAAPARLPDPATRTLLGCTVRRIEIDPAAPSAVAKLQLALGARQATILPPDWHPTRPPATDRDTGPDRAHGGPRGDPGTPPARRGES